MVQKFLFELVEGLQCLHQQGIAHGDPVLLNAFVQTAAEGERAVWVDLSSVREATEEARLMDSAAFVELCLWPMMLDSEIHSESLMRDVVAAECCAPDVLVGLHDALSVSRTDYARKDGRELRGSIFRDVDVLGRSDDFGRIRRRLCALLAAPYVLDYTISDASARFAMSLLDAERTRNAIFEEERSRLQYLEFHKEREELRKWVAELQQAVAYHNARAEKLESELNKTADALKEAQAHSRELQAAVDYHRVRSEALEQNFERVQEQQNVLVNELKKTSAELGAALSRIRDLDAAIDRHNQRSWYRRLVQPIV
jgi:DNA repair exonuclease SbcCD ATPase subunit